MNKNTLHYRIRIRQFIKRQDCSAFTECSSVVHEVNDEAGPFDTDFAGAKWNITCEFRKAAGCADALDGLATFHVVEGKADRVSVAIELVIDDWSKENYVMLPSAAYNGNRFPVRYQKYPPIPSDREDLTPDAKTMITDVPRLSIEDAGNSEIQLNTGDLSTPAISFFSKPGGYACIILMDQGTQLGNHGLRLAESKDRKQAVIRIEAPVMREKIYKMMDTGVQSWDEPADISTSDRISIRFRIFYFRASRIQDLFGRFAQVRKDMTGPVTLSHSIPFSAAYDIIEGKYNSCNWNPEGYYTVGIMEKVVSGSVYSDWQLGWVGGLMATHPLIFQGNSQSRHRALENLEWFFSKTQSKSGLFAPMIFKGRIISDEFRATDKKHCWVLIRKNADALYFMAKQLHLIQMQDPSWKIPDRWMEGTRRLCDCFKRIFEQYGQLGQFVDLDTAEILVGGSSAAGIAPAGLALCGKLFSEKSYVELAAKIARHFYLRDVKEGISTGGPGEILQCPDSESAFGLLESFVVLHETTGDLEWLKMAEEMACQCMTWCVSYDYLFPPTSFFGKLGMRSAGSVWANVQNKHSAPGICTLSGDSLFKLFRATGNMLYLDLIQEMAHNLPQYLSREGRPVGASPWMRPGFMCERVNLSDWEGKNNIGGSLFGSCWPEVSMLLTCVEIPGIYVQTDTGLVRAFDNVDVKHVGGNGKNHILKISNPTSFPARIKILMESKKASSIPLGQNYLLKCPIVDVPAGEHVDFNFTEI